MNLLILLISTIIVVTTNAMPSPIKCINFYGLETQYKNFVCSWKNNPEFYLRRLQQDMNINTIRLPFSYEYISGSDISKMDEMILLCQQLNITVILDWHRTWSSHQGAIPEEGITLDIFVSAWMNLLNRFQVYPNVKGIGLFNEIQLLNDFDYVHKVYNYVIPMIEKMFPYRFYYFLGCPSWGGNCSNMSLDHMETWNRTYIEVHKYKFSGASNREDWEISIPRRIPPNKWFVGETGWKQNIDVESTWGTGFMQYLYERNIQNVCLWTIAHSGDTDGWFKDDCETFDVDKANVVLSMLWNKNKKSHNLRSNNVSLWDNSQPPPILPPVIFGDHQPISSFSPPSPWIHV